jgi:hypothetical protein
MGLLAVIHSLEMWPVAAVEYGLRSCGLPRSSLLRVVGSGFWFRKPTVVELFFHKESAAASIHSQVEFIDMFGFSVFDLHD